MKNNGCAKKSLIILCFLFFHFTCISSDKSKSELQINKEKLLSSSLLLQNNELTGLNISLLIIDESKDFFKNLINTIAVDNQDSAFNYLVQNFHVSYILVENSSPKTISFDVNSLRLIIDDVVLKPIMKEDLPGKFKRFNTKGTIKNIYNAGVITAVTSFIVFATVACAKNGNCGGIQHIDDVLRLSQIGETNPEKLFSSFIHKTRMNYNDMIDKKNIIRSGKKAEGILFFNKQKNIMNSLIKLFYDKEKHIELKKI